MPVVRIALWAGHASKDTKANIAKEVTHSVASNLGCAEELVVVIFEEIPKESWANGGVLASDLSIAS